MSRCDAKNRLAIDGVSRRLVDYSVDHDPARSQATHLPAGLRAVCATPGNLRSALLRDAQSSVVVMTHDLEQDIAYLRASRDAPVRHAEAPEHLLVTWWDGVPDAVSARLLCGIDGVVRSAWRTCLVEREAARTARFAATNGIDVDTPQDLQHVIGWQPITPLIPRSVISSISRSARLRS